MYDVAVIGAGPSGSLAAYLLAKAGLRVAIFERKKFPRDKLCGGGISRKTSRIAGQIIDLGRVKGKEISGSYLCFKDEDLCYVSGEVDSYSVQRSHFDSLLLDAAAEKGCSIYMPGPVKEVTEEGKGAVIRLKGGEPIKASFLVLAEGVTGQLHRQLGYSGSVEWTFGLGMEVFPGSLPETLCKNTIFDLGSVSKGYAWVFPKEDRLNIGAYYFRSAGIKGHQIRELRLFLDRFEWSRDANKGETRGYPLPYRIAYPGYNTGRSLLVGDAAGCVENLYGEGLYYGMLSGRLAADTIVDSLMKNTSLNRYTILLKSRVLSHVRFSRLISRAIYSHQRFAYYNMVKSRFINSAFSKPIHTEISQKRSLVYFLAVLPIIKFLPRLEKRDPSEIGLRNQ